MARPVRARFVFSFTSSLMFFDLVLLSLTSGVLRLFQPLLPLNTMVEDASNGIGTDNEEDTNGHVRPVVCSVYASSYERPG